MEKQEYTIKEAAEILGISVSGVHRRIRGRVLESYKEGGRIIVVMSDEDIKKIKKLISKKSSSKGNKKASTGESNTTKSDKATDNELTKAVEKLTKEVERLSAEVRGCKQEIDDINNRNLLGWLFNR